MQTLSTRETKEYMYLLFPLRKWGHRHPVSQLHIHSYAQDVINAANVNILDNK